MQAENFPQGGRIGVNKNNPVFEVDVVGSICATGGIGCPSDERLKKNITELTDALSIVSKMRGVNFDWRTDEFPDKNLPQKTQIGFIAQEIQSFVPEAVIEGADGFLALDYGRLTPLLVEAIKEQQAAIERLTEKTKEIDALAKQVSELSATVSRLLTAQTTSNSSTDLVAIDGNASK